ncbi:MAG TPA: hypothetical protein VHK01_00655 [Lacipirellulaceae bacterium]|jgi:hypothetical protein|nr:hypothetical protein [Lacipirellulaceae bacterium]
MKSLPPDPDDKVLGELGSFAIGPDATVNDILCLMILLHTHQLTFARPILPTRPNIKELAALTQRGAAAVASNTFPQHTSTELYWKFNSYPGSLENMDDLPPGLKAQVTALKEKLLTHPDILSVDPED